jgi:hypothetical protein
VTLAWLAGIVLLWVEWPAGIQQLGTSAVVSYLLAWSLVFFIVFRKSLFPLAVRFLLLSGSLGLVVIACEVSAWSGLVDYRRVFHTYSREPWARPQVRLDPELLHITRPYTRYRLSGPAAGNITIERCLPVTTTVRQSYEIVYDRNGFRNTQDRDAADIAVIGDSFLEAGRDAVLLPTLLERRLQVPVVNLGQSWYGPQQELIVLKRYAVPLRPKAVVWAFFEGNDLQDVHRYNKSRERWEAITRQLQAPWMRSFTVNALLAVHRLGTPCQPSPDALGHSGLVRTAGGEVRMYFEKPARSLSTRDLDALEQVRVIFREAYELSRLHRFQLAVLFIPTKFRVYSGLVRCESDSECADWITNDLPQRLGRMLTELSPAIRYVDLTPGLAAEARKGVLVYPPDDSHWSPQGHQVAAVAVSEALSQIFASTAGPATR